MLVCFNLGKNTAETTEIIKLVYGENVSSYGAVKKWFARFRTKKF